jgi:hypothetical protein
MVYGDVARLKHSVKMEGRRPGGVYSAGDSEGLPAAITGRLNLKPEGLGVLAKQASVEAIQRPETDRLIPTLGDISE